MPHDVYVSQKSDDGWTRVSLPKNLTDKIKKAIEEELVEYNSLSSFISDAIRRRLEEIEKIKMVAEEYEMEEEDVKRMAEMEHVNVYNEDGSTRVTLKDHADGHLYDVYISRSRRGVKIFCDGDKSFDCVHVKYVHFIILPKLKEYIEMYRKKRK